MLWVLYWWFTSREKYRNLSLLIFINAHHIPFCVKIWATAWQINEMTCAPSELRSAWASTLSDQSSLCAQWVAKDPSFLQVDSEDGCPGWSESSLDAQVILLVLSCCSSYRVFYISAHVFLCFPSNYRKFPKNSDTRKIAVIILKFEQVGSAQEEWVQKMQTEWQTV